MLVWPECEQEIYGRIAERARGGGRRWVSFAPCGRMRILADWATALLSVSATSLTENGRGSTMKLWKRTKFPKFPPRMPTAPR